MSNPNIESEVQKALKDLIHIYHRVLPVKVGKEVVASVRQNFRSGGFYGSSWQRTRRQQVPFKGASGSYGPLLSKSTHLMSSTDYIPGDARVTIRNPVPYAAYHNEGAESQVTPKMKKYFWAKYYETAKIKKDEPEANKRRKRMRAPAEAEFWRNMALKKPGSKIKIPKRQFLGPSPQVDAIVTKTISTELEKYVKSL